jgi:glutaredoxin
MRWKQHSGQGAETRDEATQSVDTRAVAVTAAVTGQSAGPRITLIGKSGCHLCEDARVIVQRVAQDLAVGWVEVDIEQDAELAERYWEKVPVILVDGRPHDFWRVDERRLRTALTG